MDPWLSQWLHDVKKDKTKNNFEYNNQKKKGKKDIIHSTN